MSDGGRSGRPGVELRWPGKYDADGQRVVTPRRRPAIEVLERHGAETTSSAVVLGDNLWAMDGLVDDHAGTVDLAYIDPPFSTGGKFSVVTKIGDREGVAPPEVEAAGYSDRWAGGVGGFLAMLDPRLRLIHELLAPHGSLYVHVDPTVGHAVKLLLDEIFGARCFQREIVWRIGWVSGFKTKARNWIRNHDLIFYYTKDPRRFTFNKIYVPYPEGYTRRDGSPPTGQGMPIDDVWNALEAQLGLSGADSLDSIQIKSFSTEKTGYATQKNESLLRRIIAASSNPGDLVADPFCGSGTTLAVAGALGRRFLGVDTGRLAAHITRRRLLDGQTPFEVRSVVAAHAEATFGTGPEHVAARDAVLAHCGATTRPGDGPLHGTRDEAAVHVVGPTTVVDETAIGTVVEAARAEGFAAVDVVAWNYALRTDPATLGRGLDLRLLRILPDALDPRVLAQPGAALAEIPWPVVQVTAHGDRWKVAIEDYRLAHADDLPSSLREAVKHWSDYLDYWALQLGGPTGGPRTPQYTAYRTHRRRALPLTATVEAGESAVRVHLVDVRGLGCERRLTVGVTGGAIAVTDDVLRVGCGG